MSIFLEAPRQPISPTFAGGQAGLGDIADAALDSLLYVENENARWMARERAYDERIAQIHAATGAQLENPLRQAELERMREQAWSIPNPFRSFFAASPWQSENDTDRVQRFEQGFAEELARLNKKFPDGREAIGLDRSIDEDAQRIARDADERFGRLFESRPGLGKYGAALVGGMGGALNSPMTLMSLVAGGGPGAARTVAGRILTVAGKEALINSATEAAMQPSVQAWRAESGLDAGFDEALRNVLFAGAIGGAFGVAGRGAVEAFRPFVRSGDTERAARAFADDPRLSAEARAILNDDGLAAASSLARIRDELRPEARGALDRAETIRLVDEQRPQAASARIHDENTLRAERIVQQPAMEAWQGFVPDPEQIGRIVREIVGPDAGARPAEKAPRSLTGFLIDRGGVADYQGELRAIGADQVSERFRGRLVREGGLELDYAREAAAEAGYFDHKYGSPDEALARSTVADLLDEIAAESRGQSRPTIATAEEAAVAGVEGLVHDIARTAGPGVDDAIILRAARMSLDEGLDAFDALERVLIYDDAGAARSVGRTGDPLPGWSDEELLVASERRPLAAEPDGIDQPGRLEAEDDGVSVADVEAFRSTFGDDAMVPDADGQLVPLRAVMEDIERDGDLLNLVRACRA